MYIDKLIKKEVITLLVSVSLLVIIFIGVTYAKFLSVDKGQDTVINMGDLNISFCKDTTCDSTYTNIGQVIGTKVENGTTVPAGIYPFPDNGTYSNETPYIFKVTNTGSLDSTVKIKLKEDASFTPTGDYSSYARLTSKYANHLKVVIRKKVTFEDTGYQLGDVNMDGIVNYNDSNLILNYYGSDGNITETFNPELADINGDGSIKFNDSSSLINQIAGRAQINGLEPFYTYSYTDLEDGVIFKDDTIKSGESAIYFLWLYLDNTTPNDAQKTYFVGNIDVEGEYIPNIAAPNNFSTDSWSTIVKAIQENNIGKYNVGDTKEIDMGTYGKHTLRIANKSTPSECSTEGFSQTACGFVLEFQDIITTSKMNTAYSNTGGWNNAEMNTFINNNIYNSLPNELKEIIIDTIVVSSYGKNDTANFTTTNKLYLLAPKEIYTDYAETTDTAKDLTRILDYYKEKRVTMNSYANAIKYNNSTATWWWLRNVPSSNSGNFFGVNVTGILNNNYAHFVGGVSPAFRIG